jgi:Flp pilus assembly protein TadG
MRRFARRLGDESGQSLVFVLLLLPALFLLVALVVNVGAWLQGQRQAQNVADAAALAAVQALPAGNLQAVADSYADANWSGFTSAGSVSLRGSSGPGTQSVSVHASHPVAGFFGSLTGILGITVGANATARVQVADRVKGPIPIGVACTGGCRPWLFDRPATFTWSAAANAPNTFTPVRLSGVTTGNFRTLAGCDARTPTGRSCVSGTFALGSYRTLNVNADTIAGALDANAGVPHLVPVYDSLGRGRVNRSLQVVGWAAFTVDDVNENGAATGVDVTGHFDTILVDNSLLSSSGSSGADDFGVHAVGLVK